LGLACILETPGWDQRASSSRKITLKHFIQKLEGAQKSEAEDLFKEVTLLPSYSELWHARDNIIFHSGRETLMGYSELAPEEAFPNLTLDELAKLLQRVHEIARVALVPQMDFSIPGFEGVDELFRVLRRALDE